MNISRREFLQGAAAFGLGGWRLFAAPAGWKHGGKPNLVFGVVSDTHLRTTADGKYSTRYWSDKWLVAAFRCFRDNNVDAVLHLGDMAHTGQRDAHSFAAIKGNELLAFHEFGNETSEEVAHYIRKFQSAVGPISQLNMDLAWSESVYDQLKYDIPCTQVALTERAPDE